MKSFPYIYKVFGGNITVDKWITAGHWEKATLIRWPSATLFSADNAEAKEFHANLGKAIAFAEKLSVMSDDELNQLAGE